MKNYNFTTKSIKYLVLVLILGLLLMPDFAEARRGMSFGGSRRSFGGFKRSAPTPSYKPQSSFGSKRSAPGATSKAFSSEKKTSFGGSRLNSSRDYTQKYGTPRKTEQYSRPGTNGMMQNYRVNNYGGYGSGLMTGYMLGHTSWMWSMPFHPAFYYSRPYYVTNQDGTVDVYPPTFSWGRMIFTAIIIVGIIYIIYRILRARRGGGSSQSSFN